MNDEPRAENPETLAQALETIDRQREEIGRLERRLADERLAEDLRDALTLATAAGTIASPVTHSRLLEMIVETAAHVIFARAAAGLPAAARRTGETTAPVEPLWFPLSASFFYFWSRGIREVRVASTESLIC